MKSMSYEPVDDDNEQTQSHVTQIRDIIGEVHGFIIDFGSEDMAFYVHAVNNSVLFNRVTNRYNAMTKLMENN